MTLELYLINQESRYKLYHNSSKIDDSKLEDLVNSKKEEINKKRIRFRKIKNYLNNTRIKKYLDNYVKKALTKLQNQSLMSFKAASLIADVNINYSSNLTEKKAKKTYKKIIRREIYKNSLSMGLNLVAIALCYIPPLTFIQGTSIPFVLIGYHSVKNLGSILKGEKNVEFVKNKELSLLEDIIENNNPIDNLKNKDLLEYYETNYGE